jgi:hypothetical protein
MMYFMLWITESNQQAKAQGGILLQPAASGENVRAIKRM